MAVIPECHSQLGNSIPALNFRYVMDHLEFYNSKVKLVGLFGLTILMVGVSYFCTTLPGLVPQVFGWLGVCFFGLGLVIIPARFFRSRPEVVIDRRGIEDRRLGIGLIPWEDVIGVSVRAIRSSKFLSVEVSEPGKYLTRYKPWQRQMARANRALGFSEISIAFTGLSPSLAVAWKYIEQVYGSGVDGRERERNK